MASPKWAHATFRYVSAFMHSGHTSTGALSAPVPEHPGKPMNASHTPTTQPTAVVDPSELLHLCADVMAVVRFNGEVLYVNDAVQDLLGRDANSLIGASIVELIHPTDHDRVMSRMEAVSHGAPPIVNSMRVRHASGEWVPIELTAKSMTLEGEGGESQLVLMANIRNVSERNELLDRLRFQATHDTLTGLLSLDGLHEQLETHSFSTCVAVLRLDADGFQRINEFYGHRFGDSVMARFGARLAYLAGDDALVARLGGDDFVVLKSCPSRLLTGSPNAGSRDDLDLALESFARTFVSLLTTPDEVNGISVDLAFTVGVAHVEHGSSFVSAIDEAESALRHAKQFDLDISVFDHSMRQASERRRSLEGALRKELQQPHRISLSYQPVLEADTRRVVSFEGLARWTTEEGETISPNEFVPIAEATGLMTSLTHHVMALAVAQLSNWNNAGLGAATVSINVPVGQLQRTDFIDTLAGLLQHHNVAGSRVIIELTESSMIERLDVVRGTLAALRSMGCSIAIDDFGTGYSSYGWLRDLPVDYIKLDRSFVTPLAEEPTAVHIVRSMVDLCTRLGFKVVAEGVETRTQADMLTALGVDRLQGYLFSVPTDPIGAASLFGQRFDDDRTSSPSPMSR
jgi:diguanylate cyclase (GGDEF)-like protein/PAS domain S-box-containing protein